RYPWPAGRLENLLRTSIYFGRRTVSLMTAWNFSSTTWPIPLLGLALVAVAVVLLDRRSPQSAAIRGAGLSALTLTVVSGLLVVDTQIWWLGVPCLAVMVISFVGIPRLLGLVGLAPIVHRLVRVILMVAALGVFVRSQVKDRPPYPWQPDV